VSSRDLIPVTVNHGKVQLTVDVSCIGVYYMIADINAHCCDAVILTVIFFCL